MPPATDWFENDTLQQVDLLILFKDLLNGLNTC